MRSLGLIFSQSSKNPPESIHSSIVGLRCPRMKIANDATSADRVRPKIPTLSDPPKSIVPDSGKNSDTRKTESAKMNSHFATFLISGRLFFKGGGDSIFISCQFCAQKKPPSEEGGFKSRDYRSAALPRKSSDLLDSERCRVASVVGDLRLSQLDSPQLGGEMEWDGDHFGGQSC